MSTLAFKARVNPSLGQIPQILFWCDNYTTSWHPAWQPSLFWFTLLYTWDLNPGSSVKHSVWQMVLNLTANGWDEISVFVDKSWLISIDEEVRRYNPSTLCHCCLSVTSSSTSTAHSIIKNIPHVESVIPFRLHCGLCYKRNVIATVQYCKWGFIDNMASLF